MHGHDRRWQALRERHAPWQRRGAAVVVADQEAADSADGVPDGETGRGGGEHRHGRQTLALHDPQAGEHPPGQAAEPAQSAAGEQQGEERLLAEMLEDPEQFGPGHASGEAGHGRVESAVRQPRAQELTAEQPQPDERTGRNECAEARDLEAADTEQNGIDDAPLGQRRSLHDTVPIRAAWHPPGRVGRPPREGGAGTRSSRRAPTGR